MPHRRSLIPRPALWRGLSRRLLLATLVTMIVATGAMIAFVTHQSRNTTSELATRYGIAVAEAQARRIEALIGSLGAVARTMAATIAVAVESRALDRLAPIATLQEVLEATPSALGAWIVLEPGADADGVFSSRVARRDGGIVEEPAVAARALSAPWYTRTRDTGRPAIVEPAADPVAGAGTRVVTLSVPVRVDGAFAGAVGVDFAIDDLSRLLAAVRPLGGTVGLMGGGGRWIAAPDPALVGRPVELGLAGAAPPPAALAEPRVVDLDGASGGDAGGGSIRRILVPFEAGGTGTVWAIVCDLPAAALGAPASALRDSLIVMAIVIALGIVLALGGTIRQLLGVPLARTSLEIQRLAAGAIEGPVGGGDRRDEIGHINRALEDYRLSLLHDRRLREELLRILSALDLADEGILVAGGDGRIVFANMAAARFMGVPGPVHLTGEAWAAIVGLEPGGGVEDAAAALEADGEWAAVLFHRHAGEERVVQLRARALPLGAGTVLVLADAAVVCRREASRRTVEARLRQAQKMEAVGQLTGGIAHDFNNLLTVILGNGELLAAQAGLDAKGREAASLLLSAGDRAAALVAQLLAFSRRQPLRPQPMDIAARVRALVPLLSRTLGEKCEVAVVCEEEGLIAAVDGTQLDTAIINLCLNARDAMAKGGRVTITIRGVVLDRDDPVRDTIAAAPPAPGAYVAIEAADTGRGIPASQLPRVFEPFFTTKEVGAGSGLGLSMVYGFATQSGGGVAIDSSAGGGTTVQIWLPRIV